MEDVPDDAEDILDDENAIPNDAKHVPHVIEDAPNDMEDIPDEVEYVLHEAEYGLDEAEGVLYDVEDVPNDVPEMPKPSKVIKNGRINQKPLKTASRADRMDHVADEPRADLSHLGNGERNSPTPKAREGRVSGSERVHWLRFRLN